MVTKERVAVLGGGIAALSTVFELTSVPGWRDRFEITVYQLGWRLGGKCASSCNQALGDRVEEHGLHLFYGFYDNVFRLLKECYGELGRPPSAPLATWQQAVKPLPDVLIAEQQDAAWDFWPLPCPANDQTEGQGAATLEPMQALLRLLDGVRQLLQWGGRPGRPSRRRLAAPRERPGAYRLRHPPDPQPGRPARLRSTMLRRGLALLSGQRLPAARRIVKLLNALVLDAVPRSERRPEAQRTGLASAVEQARQLLYASPLLRDARRVFIGCDLLLTIARGLVKDGLLEPPFDWFKLDDLDTREWLTKHGASQATLDSALLAGVYAAAFCTPPLRIGAGTHLHAIMRMVLTYKGSFMWRLQAGMGETLIAPLYLVLRRRGVRFQFFHWVERLELTPDRRQVARVVCDLQAIVKGDSYEPLIDIQGLPAWPEAPLYDQLENGTALRQSGQNLESYWNAEPPAGRVTLEAGRDFDRVVLGLSIGALPATCAELIADGGNPRFAAMVNHVKTCSIQAAQLWFNPSLPQLGWPGDSPVVIPFAAPFDTWADMSHLLARERWPAGACGSVQYLCALLPDEEPPPPRADRDYLDRQRGRVQRNLKHWLDHSGTQLWPQTATTHSQRDFNWYWLADPEERTGAARLAAQFLSTPANLSDRYVLSVPGSSQFRLRADESGYSNLVLTGDWTRTALSIGCVEAAVMSGHQAAGALDPRARGAIGDWLGDSPPAARIAAEPPPPAQPPTPGDSRGLPHFIHTDGNLIAEPPIDLDVTVYMFLLRADPVQLRRLCDEQLNLGGRAGPVYRPLAPFVVLYCSRVDNYPTIRRIGWVPEIDFGVWVPLAAGIQQGPLFRPQRVVCYTPYIWVDNGLALVGGRTVFGFPKQLGRMRMPGGTADAAQQALAAAEPFTLDTEVIPRFSAAAKSEERRLLAVRRLGAPGRSGLATGLWRGGTVLLDALAARVRQFGQSPTELTLPGWDLLRESWQTLGRRNRLVFLKQFMDAADGSRACYQAIVEADIHIVSDLRGAPLGAEYAVDIHRYDSHRLVETLGLSPTAQGPSGAEVATVPALMSGMAQFRARVDRGQIVWEAPRPRPLAHL